MLMDPPALLSFSPPAHSKQLRQHTDQVLCKIIRANYECQFAQVAPELSEFRHATVNHTDELDDDVLSDVFRNTVQLTTYDAYAGLIRMFYERPCKASAVVNLLAPGLPDYIVESSSTSGGVAKHFPVYNALSHTGPSSTESSTILGPFRERTTANMWYLWCDRMDIEGEGDSPVKPVYEIPGSGAFRRMKWNLDPENDKEKMGTFIRDLTAPYAAAFVRKYRPFLLIHALFAIASRSLETMSVVFITTFVDMMRQVDLEFDMLVDSIKHGTIPTLDGVEELRPYLEPNLLPDPERAAELHSLGSPSTCSGWCGRVWPNLRSVTGIASGAFASSVPLARWYLGPTIDVCSGYYGCTEAAAIGSPYNPRELNQFKLTKETVIEFLDVTRKEGLISAIAQQWEVETGGRYEVLLTTRDGLWRYRLGDVVEIVGFDPSDGAPIVRFIERRNVILRFPDFMITEKELRAAMSFTSEKTLTYIVEWTATIDRRHSPATIGFFIELADDQVSDLFLGSTEHIVTSLARSNTNVDLALRHKTFSKPVIWFVRSGTFREFRQMRLDEGSNNVGQIKVPVVLPKIAYVVWFSNRVVREL